MKKVFSFITMFILLFNFTSMATFADYNELQKNSLDQETIEKLHKKIIKTEKRKKTLE